MARLIYWIVPLSFSLCAGIAYAAGHHRPQNIPANPTNVETVAVSLAGPCVGFGWHNPDEVRTAVFGLDADGLAVQRGAYDFMREWAAGEACQPAPGVSAEAGILYGQRQAADAADEYVAIGYRISLGANCTLRVLGGGFFEGWNRKRKAHPVTVNAFGIFPFLTLQFFEKF